MSCTASDTISALASKGYWVPGQTCLPAGWVGGVVVTSDQPIVAIGRPHIGTEVMTYNSFSSGSLTSYLPMLFKNAFGGTYDSAFYVQNVGASTATLSIKYYDSTGTLTCTTNDDTSPRFLPRAIGCQVNPLPICPWLGRWRGGYIRLNRL